MSNSENSESASPRRLLLVHGQALVATAVAQALGSRGWAQTTIVPSLQELVRWTDALADDHQPDAAVVDMGLDSGSATGAVAVLAVRLPLLPIIVLTESAPNHGADAEHDWQLRAAEQIGCHAFSTRSGTIAHLEGLIGAVVRRPGPTPIPMATPTRGPSMAHEPTAAPLVLTRRERTILDMLAAGEGTQAMADELGLSPHTIRNHLRAVMRKLGAHSRVQAVMTATRTGLIDPPLPRARDLRTSTGTHHELRAS